MSIAGKVLGSMPTVVKIARSVSMVNKILGAKGIGLNRLVAKDFKPYFVKKNNTSVGKFFGILGGNISRMSKSKYGPFLPINVDVLSAISTAFLPRPQIGSKEYEERIMSIAEIKGYKAAYYQMVSDVNGPYKEQYEDFNSENVKNFNKLIEKVIVNIGPENIDEELHYSRNNLNRAFPTLQELIAYNESVTDDEKWKKISSFGTSYHMNGKDGIFNVKYVSADEHFEAIYNKNGVLLTEKNDAENMSSYNFFGPNKGTEHKAYDVDPYFKYGNTEEKKLPFSLGVFSYNTAAFGNGVDKLSYDSLKFVAGSHFERVEVEREVGIMIGNDILETTENLIENIQAVTESVKNKVNETQIEGGQMLKSLEEQIMRSIPTGYNLDTIWDVVYD